MLFRMLRYPYGNVQARAMAADSRALTAADVLAALHAAGHSGETKAQGEDGAERRLQEDYLDFGCRVARSLPGAARDLILSYLQRNEVENLKLICRSALQGKAAEAGKLLPGPGKRTPFAELADAASLEELGRRLPRSSWRDAVRRALSAPPAERLFRLETDLDRLFWARMQTQLERLLPFDRRAAGEILGRRADLDRFSLVVRGWRGGVAPAAILAGLPPLGTLFPRRQLRSALQNEEPAEALRSLAGPEEAGDPLSRRGELRLWRRLDHFLRRLLRAPPFDISPSLSAVLLKEIDVRERRGIRAGVRFGAGEEILLSTLVAGG